MTRFLPFFRIVIGTILAWSVCLQAHGQTPERRKSETPEIRELQEQLAKRQAKLEELQTQEIQIKRDVELLRLEVRTAEARLQAVLAKQQPQGALPRASEQRLQMLEQQVAALLKEVQSLRRGRTASKFIPVDFQALTNQKRKESFHGSTYVGNHLESLGDGEKRLLDIPFQLGDGILQLGSTEVADKPAVIKGIKVGHKLANLHFLHATAYYLEDEMPIGSYTINYADGSSEKIPIVNGKDVTDWWKYSFSKPPSTGKIAWEGVNQGSKELDATIWLFLTTWKNPKPEIPITSIDFGSNMETRCAPFCVAITGEAP